MSNSSNQTEFKNEHLTVQLSREPGSIAKLHISVSPTATKAAYEKAVKSVNKEVTLPGFRKGKAPRDLVVQMYGKHVENEQREIVVNTSFTEALDLLKMRPFTNESIKVTSFKSMSNDKGSDFSIQFESYPDVPAIDPKALHLNQVQPDQISDEQVKNSVQELRLWHAEWIEVSDRPVKENDYIDLDIDLLEDPERNLCKDTRFEVKDKKMGTWMRKLVVGKNVGDTVEGMSEKEGSDDECKGCDDPTHHHTQEFKPTKCRITIKSIKEPKLPEIDDAFAAKVGLKQANELEGKVKEDLERQAKDRAQNAMRGQLEKALNEQYPFEIPESIISNEIEYRLQAKMDELIEDGESNESVEARKSEIEKQVAEEAKQAYRVFFLLSKVISEQKLNVAQDEIMREYVKQMYMPAGESFISQKMEPEEIQRRLSSYILNRKAKDFLIEQATK